jgi:hypothetical protein
MHLKVNSIGHQTGSCANVTNIYSASGRIFYSAALKQYAAGQSQFKVKHIPDPDIAIINNYRNWAAAANDEV